MKINWFGFKRRIPENATGIKIDWDENGEAVLYVSYENKPYERAVLEDLEGGPYIPFPSVPPDTWVAQAYRSEEEEKLQESYG